MATFEELANLFNMTLISFVNEFSKISSDSVISINKDIILSLLNDPESKYTYIKFFVFNLLKYKDKIDNKDDAFFLNREVNKEAFNKLTEKTDNVINYIFEFKTTWTKLSSTNKNVVFTYMQALANFANNFFVLLDKANFEVDF